MRLRYPIRIATPAALVWLLLSGFQAPAKAPEQFVQLLKGFLLMDQPASWSTIEGLTGIKWAALPPTSLQNCLPNGDCFARQGTLALGATSVTVVATGARTMAINLLFRTSGPPLGETAVLAALKSAGVETELVRCPVRAGAGGTNWFRLSGTGLAPAHLSIQPPAANRPTEGYVLSPGDALPALQPAQLSQYSEQCAAGAERKVVSSVKPHEQLATTVVGLLTPAAAPALPDWKALVALPVGLEWTDDGPRAMNRAALGDPNPMGKSTVVSYAGRKFSVTATGTAAAVKTIHLEEMGTHPRGEHMLGVVYEKGIAVQLVRCGPVYTESTNNWYSLKSAGTRPAMIRQSIHYDGNLVSDTYELRLDGTLPPRDPRDRNPGTAGC